MNKESEFNIGEISAFLGHFYKLKEIKRTGWKSKLHLNDAESVAEHTLTMVVFALLFSEFSNYSPKRTIKMIKMILIHDLGESMIGDYTPKTIDFVKKKQLENSAINTIISKIPWITIKTKYYRLWKEFDENSTEISKMIHLIDKLEMAIQASYYMENRKDIKKEDIRPFLESASSYVIQKHKIRDTKNSNNLDIEKKDVEEIKQILLDFCK
ncbi:MAG: HD domain-containing protein [Nitrosopumilus sp.]|nr:HD domain-containing protein [Nitrosopumilus sp.]